MLLFLSIILCSHFADVVVSNDPDVLALQEVRLDANFLSATKTRHWFSSGSGSGGGSNDSAAVLLKADGGSQVEHLLSHLAQARARAANTATAVGSAELQQQSPQHYYQFVYHPAMSMIDTLVAP